MFHNRIAAAVAAVSLSSTPVAAATIADVFSSFWVFGDSLSDSGNLSAFLAAGDPPIVFPPPPYFQGTPTFPGGRFSNGPVWHEEFLTDFGPLASGSFAVGGALADADGIIDLPFQVTTFLANVPPLILGDNPLAAIWAGANDMLGAVAQSLKAPPGDGSTPPLLGTTAMAALAGIRAGIDALDEHIDEFVLFNLPDLGGTPRLLDLDQPGLPPLASQFGREATLAFNSGFDALVTDLRAQGLTIYTVDVFDLFERARTNPQDFGLSVVDEACFPVEPFALLREISVPPVPCGTPETFLYWDQLHPTSVGHRAVAAAFDAALPAIPLPAPAFLLLGGLVGLALFRRRRAA